MDLEELVQFYPRLYHMANDGTWATILKWGLLSTTALLDKFGTNGDERYLIESCHRSDSVEIRHPLYGSVVIRDQAPMREAALRGCLRDMTPQAWYELLNRKAFFWVTEARVQTLLNARLYRDNTHTVITIDTESLVREYADRVTLSPINSGNTLYVPQPRGTITFHPLADYPFVERRRMRGVANAVAELAVEYSVPDLRNHTMLVERRRGSTVVERLYSR